MIHLREMEFLYIVHALTKTPRIFMENDIFKSMNLFQVNPRDLRRKLGPYQNQVSGLLLSLVTER